MMNTKPVTGQYECLHKSGVGLDYFTSRIDRLVLQSDGRFVLTTQQRSRVVNAAQSLLNGQQATAAVPETRLEGRYVQQQSPIVTLYFDNGGLEEARLAADGAGLQIGPNFFNKISDSTMLPPTSRMKQDMEDIAKGLKIASAIGGMAIKAAKTIQQATQAAQEPDHNQTPVAQNNPPTASSATAQQHPPVYTPPPAQPPPAQSVYTPPASTQQRVVPPSSTNNTQEPAPGHVAPVFCDQCGARVRPGKRFCNNCGARLD